MKKTLFSIAIVGVLGFAVLSGCSSSKSSSSSGSDTVITASGLKYIELPPNPAQVLTEVFPHKGQRVTVNYTGTLTNGTAFDSNVLPEFGHQSPFIFTIGVGQVIKGWDEGVMTMKVGSKRRLIVPANLAYGDRAVGDKIPANSTLIFDVELLKVQ